MHSAFRLFLQLVLCARSSAFGFFGVTCQFAGEVPHATRSRQLHSTSRLAPGKDAASLRTFASFESETVSLQSGLHPEDARLAATGPRDVTLYTRPGCHLCEEAKAAIAPVLREFGAALREVNIDDDAVLRERYRWDVPVIFLGAHKVAKHRVNVEQFRRQLRDAG
jgi:glutaredoxin